MILQTLTKKQVKQSWSQDAHILGTYAGMDSMTWRLGLIDSLENIALEKALVKLSKETSVPNPFFELPILKAAVKSLSDEEVRYLYLSKQNGVHESVELFAPVCLSSIGIFRHTVLRTWNHLYAPLGMPLVADDPTGEILDAFIKCIHSAEHPDANAIVFEQVAKEGDFINNLYNSQLLSDRLLLATGATRAGLKPLKNLDYIGTHFSGKRKQKLRKAKAELEAIGEVAFHKYSNPESIVAALDDFLALEENSWKGQRKTALNSTKNSATFCREAVINSAKQNNCQIQCLKLDDETIASLISFYSNGYVYPWKIAFNNRYAKHSVGNLLATHATSEFAKLENFRGLDSLAAEHNETTHRFWPDEKEFFTITIGIGKNASQTSLCITEELNRIKRIRTTLRDFLKKRSYLARLVSSLRM